MCEEDRLHRLTHTIEHAAHLLPSQGPIEVFVHHNTLHAFEHLPFHAAVAEAGKLFGCQSYLPEDRYRDELARGRILPADLSAVLIEELGDESDQLIGFLGTRFHLRLAMLQHSLRVGPDAELEWLLAETDALYRICRETPPAARRKLVDETRHWILRDFFKQPGTPRNWMQDIVPRLLLQFGVQKVEQWSDGTWEAFTLHLLWEICLAGRTEGMRHQPAEKLNHDIIEGLTPPARRDSDRLVNELLIRFCASFLDQGFSHAELPNRGSGFYRSFIELYRSGGTSAHRPSRLRGELNRLHEAGIGPLESIAESLRLLEIAEEDEEHFLQETLLALPGWAGMLWQMETNAEWAVHPAPPGTLIEYLAVRLILERVRQDDRRATQRVSGVSPPIPSSKPSSGGLRPPLAGAFQIFQLAQVRGWSPSDLHRLSKSEWKLLSREIESFSEGERRKIYQLAYERRYRNQALDALWRRSLRGDGRSDETYPALPTFQMVCCIDDREESFRRHLEEVDPRCETYGAAGFFAVAMYYRGVADAHFRPLCPNIIKPSHYVQEEVVYSLTESHRRRSETRRALGTASHRWHLGTRTFSGGIVTGLLGSLASVPMVTRILFPRTAARLRKRFGRIVQPPSLTELRMQRVADPPSEEHPGYTLDEMAGIVERILREIGLTSGFSRLIIFAGHGSSSLNNPHESAYNCGACSGGHGGANARVFCRMANHPRVRELLSARGLTIPDETFFLGGEHNTCDDSVEFFDLDRLPLSHVQDYERAWQAIDEARRRNAHERCRRFESANLTLTPAEALLHVEGRAEDLSQARPEYNHATNALCIVGRRELTSGLFLDRRAFLASYDPSQDDADHSILGRILAAVVPVCAGISLEYYFSTVDVAGYGCGSKLPHNITSLLGVMEGAASDLRPGLSAQMTEIHEPLRILFVVESTPAALLLIMDRNEMINRLVRNEWVQLAVVEGRGARDGRPGTKEVTEPVGEPPTIHLFHQGRFEPYFPENMDLPMAASSLDWYRGWRDHLGFALIKPAERLAQPPSGKESGR